MRPEFAALDASIEGEVIHPESPEYESVRRPAWGQYENVRPEAVVRCRTPTDVAQSLAVARRLDLEVAPRGGGHCFAGRSATGGLVIELSAMSSVGQSDGIATVGAGRASARSTTGWRRTRSPSRPAPAPPSESPGSRSAAGSASSAARTG